MKRLRTLVVGCGHMGASHARAYHRLADDFEIVGLVSRTPDSRQVLNRQLGQAYPEFSDFAAALKATRPDVVCISTYTETHAEYALASLAAGAHVFLEKPIASTIADAEQIIAAAGRAQRKLVVGYILQVHPSWTRFTELARTLGKPLVMRMNLNQQSAGSAWATHKNLLRSTSPIVDCGVHYVDIMCRMTGARPVSVNGIAVRLTDEIASDRNNYGHLQVTFSDGSVGWYEAGWGPMISETAFFVKDVFGPNGSASIVAATAGSAGNSSNIDAHTKTESIRLHQSARKPDGTFTKSDELITLDDEPDHDELCRREQVFLLRAIRENLDLSLHWQSALDSLRIVLAADQSAREGRTVLL
jgi:predicted dehydrogenase